MREFSKVSPSLWRSKRFNNLPSEMCKLIYLYLLTSEHQNSAGAYRLPAGYASHDLNLSIEDFEAARDEVVKAELILFDAETDEYFITRWFKHNPPMNEKHSKGITSTLAKLESQDLLAKAIESLNEVEALRISKSTESSQKPNFNGGNDLTQTVYLNGRNRK